MERTRNGCVRDFVAVGDVDIKVIGADNQILDSSVPIRQILEQLVSKTGIPPFMLGLSWSSPKAYSPFLSCGSLHIPAPPPGPFLRLRVLPRHFPVPASWSSW